MKKTYIVSYAVFSPLPEGHSAQHRPQKSSGSRHVMARDITGAIQQVQAQFPEAEVTSVSLSGVIDDLEG